MTPLSSAAISDAPLVAAYAIFLTSYVVFAIGKFPGFKIDRTGAAIIGAVGDGCVSNRSAGGGTVLHRLRHYRPAVLDDANRWESPPGWFFRVERGDGTSTTESRIPASGGHLHVRVSLGVLRERHCLPSDGAVCSQHHPSHETGAPSLPPCGCHRFEHR